MPSPSTSTHDVVNQTPPLEAYDVYGADTVLCEAVARAGILSPEQDDDLHALGRLAGSAEAARWGFAANRQAPELRTFDRYGHRIDEVEFHPSYHRLLEAAVTAGLAAAPWSSGGSHAARAAGFVVWSQVDAGVGCPASMTYACVPVLCERPDLAAAWLPAVTARAYDPGLRPVAAKAGALVGMAMTEKQGG